MFFPNTDGVHPKRLLKLGPYFWQKLYFFYYAVHFKDLSEAANHLGVDKSAMTRAVQTLEARLKQPLLHRLKKGWQLSDAGVQLFKAVGSMIDTLSHVEGSLNQPACPQPLRLSIPEWLLCDYGLEALQAFSSAYPNTPFVLDTATDSTEAVRIAVCAQGIAGFDAAQRVEKPLWSFRAGIYASPAYLKRAGLPKSLGDLAEHRRIAFHSTDPVLQQCLNWPDLMASQSLPLLSVQDRKSLIRLAQHGVGIIGYIQDHPDLQNSGLLEIVTAYSGRHSPIFEVVFQCSHSDWQQAAVQQFYQHLKKVWN
jgi:DNA-binding transcriptional LysR family regulator